MSPIPTRAPWRTSDAAVALPMPRASPVIATTRPFKLMNSFAMSLLGREGWILRGSQRLLGLPGPFQRLAVELGELRDRRGSGAAAWFDPPLGGQRALEHVALGAPPQGQGAHHLLRERKRAEGARHR